MVNHSIKYRTGFYWAPRAIASEGVALWYRPSQESAAVCVCLLTVKDGEYVSYTMHPGRNTETSGTFNPPRKSKAEALVDIFSIDEVVSWLEH